MNVPSPLAILEPGPPGSASAAAVGSPDRAPTRADRAMQRAGRAPTLRSVVELRAALGAARRGGHSIGLVPTMGALHDGHLSLIRRAREDCDEVVVSLFVNPAQFGPHEDLAGYPRDEARDATLAGEAGADLLFAPGVDEVYPDGFSTSVSVTGITEVLEGEQRGVEHFQGVATVVTKLLNMVMPDVAYFGQKDAQQLVMIRRLVRDLDLPVEIVGCPTVREPDGLAMSSRNAYLSPAERSRAAGLHRALEAARAMWAEGQSDAGRLAATARSAMVALGVEPDYVAVVDPDTLAPLRHVERHALVAVAARVGVARLIDNELFEGPQETEQPCNA